MISEPTNSERAYWAKIALATFTRQTFSGEHPDSMHLDDLKCAVSDLICDLLHFAKQQGCNITGLLQQAAGHFGCESEGGDQ